MKSNKFYFSVLTGLLSLLLQINLISAAELTPNVTNPAQKTPPEAGSDVGGIKVPPAVPLDKLSSPSKAPSVAAKKSGETPAVKTTTPPPAPKPVEKAERQTIKASGQAAGATTDEGGTTTATTPQPAPSAETAEKAVAAPDTAPLEKLVGSIEDEGGPAGSATSTVSQPLRAADEKTVETAEKKREEEGVFFNVAGEDIREIIKQISRVTGTNFILDDKIRGEVTIISEKKMTKEEVYEAFLSALDVAGYTTVPGPAGLTKIVKKRDALTRPIPIYTDKTPYTDKFITRLVTLKNISAIDMANAIKGLVSKEGNLFAYPATNTLIITDTGTNIERIVRMVQELDTEGPQEVLEIIHIEYADVKDMADKISKLFGGTQQTTSRRTSRRRGKAATQTQEALPTVNKIISDERTNSLIVLASKITIAKVKDIIRRLDRPLIGPEEGDIHVLYLKNAKASEMAEVLTGVTQAAKKAKQETKKTTTRAKRPSVPQAEFEGLFGSIKSIKADDNTNSLIVQANAKDFRLLVDRIIAKLDIPRRQVYIEANIMEIGLRQGRELGTGILGGKTFSVGGNELALFGNTFPFIPDITSTSGVGGATTQNPISLTPPFSDNPINFPKFFAAFIAQSDEAELNILSSPNILTLDNTEARIKVGDTIPFLTGSALTTGGVQTSNIQREDVALELKVKPQITEGDNVRLEIKQKIEDFSEASNPLEATAGPATSIREIESEIVVPDKRTIVLGGLMQDRESSRKTKIPLLGDIPILGYLFKGTSHSKTKINLLIFLTPTIIREPGDFLAVLKQRIEQRNRFIDDHFGERARKRIRGTIERHNTALLNFQTATSPLSEPGILPTDPLVGSPELQMDAGDAAPPSSDLSIDGELTALPPAAEAGYDEEPTTSRRQVQKGRRSKLKKGRVSRSGPDTSVQQPSPPPPAPPAPRIATEPPVTNGVSNGAASSPPPTAAPTPPPPAPQQEAAAPNGSGMPNDIDLAF